MAGTPESGGPDPGFDAPDTLGSVAGSSRPVTVWNTLTNQVWGYASAADLLGASAAFTFANVPPGIYEISNGGTSGNIPVILGNATYTILPGTKQTFNAHQNVKIHNRQN